MFGHLGKVDIGQLLTKVHMKVSEYRRKAVNRAAGPGGQRWVSVDFEGGALLARDCCVPKECTVLFEFPIVFGYVELRKYACHNPQSQRGKRELQPEGKVTKGNGEEILESTLWTLGRGRIRPHFFPLAPRVATSEEALERPGSWS